MLKEILFPNPPEKFSDAALPEGDLPPLKGTLWHNRPAGHTRAGLAYRHWLDGDGYVTALRLFSPRGPWVDGRYVDTSKRKEEGAAGKPLFRAFGTAFSGDRLRAGTALEPTANIHIQRYQGRLLAFGEQSLPWELDPKTLATRGPYDFQGRLGPLAPFSAHAKLVDDDLFNFGVDYHPKEPKLHLYRIGPESSQRSLPLDGPRAPHDFAITPRHLVFALAPHFLDTDRFLGGASFVESLVYRPEAGLRLWVVDRTTLTLKQEHTVPARYSIHLANAYDEGGDAVLETVEYDRPLYPTLTLDSPNGEPLPSRLMRYRLGGPLQQECLWEEARMADFPVAGQMGYRSTLWGLGSSRALEPGPKFFDELWRFKDGPTVYRLPKDHYFSGDPLRKDDWLWAFVASPGRSAYWLFEADRVEAGPRGTLTLPSPVPVPVHGHWD